MKALATLSRRVAASRPGAAVFSRILPPLDDVVHRLSGGRRSFAGIVADVEVVRVTTTGARTGEPRTVPLLALFDDDRVVIVGSNWGRPSPPAWLGNLRVTPVATVEHAGRTWRCAAREADGTERERFWPRLDAMYEGYPAYRARAGREIALIVLEPLPVSY